MYPYGLVPCGHLSRHLQCRASTFLPFRAEVRASAGLERLFHPALRAVRAATPLI